jgi:large subunit ribosomal protein L4
MDILTLSGTVKGTVELPDSIFGRTGSQGIVWESVRCYLANQRQGTACTKTRAEVSGTGKKPYRQKHTGRARHGSRRSPIFKGGGVVFGPRPRDYSYELPKKLRKQAMCLALSAKHTAGAVKVVEDFEPAEPKTKQLAQTIAGLGLKGSVLLLAGTTSANMKRASRNIPWLTVVPAAQANPYWVLGHDNVIITEQGLKALLAYSGKAS